MYVHSPIIVSGNFPFMEFWVRRRAVRSKPGQAYLLVERVTEGLVSKRRQLQQGGGKEEEEVNEEQVCQVGVHIYTTQV